MFYALYRCVCILCLIVGVTCFTGFGLYALWLSITGVADRNGYWSALAGFTLAVVSFLIFRAMLRFGEQFKE